MDLPTDPLDEFENSMKSPISPEMNLYTDPICRNLDYLECTIESQHMSSPSLFDPQSEMLDNLEGEIEQWNNLSPISSQAAQTQDLASPEVDDHGFQERAGGPKSTTPPMPDFEETPTTKQYSMPVPGMRGHSGNRGRNIHDDAGHYCYLHQAWVLPEDCEDCQDFEQDEYTPEDEEKRCKHSVSQAGEDSDD